MPDAKHTSINTCGFGADLVTTDPKTGRVKMVQWTWEELQEFILTYGKDVTDQVAPMVTEFLAEKKPEPLRVAACPTCQGHPQDCPHLQPVCDEDPDCLSSGLYVVGERRVCAEHARKLTGRSTEPAETEAAAPDDGKVRCSTHNQVWPCHVCAGQERGG